MVDAVQIAMTGLTTTFLILLSLTIVIYGIGKVAVWRQRKRDETPKPPETFSGETRERAVTVEDQASMVAVITTAIHSSLQSGMYVQEP
ncbi:MAG: OadG family protein [Candidatus Bathyarchaeia archaeon]